MHARQQIREAFLAAVRTIAGLTVYNGRVFPVYDSVLPAATVYSREEIIDDEQGRKQRQQHRRAAITVEGFLKADENLDDGFDDFSEDVEQVVMVDTTINQLVRCLDLINTEMTVNAEGEKAMGVCTMTFSCRYITNDGQPETILK